MVGFLYFHSVEISVTIYEKDARSMLFELLTYSDKLGKEAKWLSSKGPLHNDEVKRFQYLTREISRVNRAMYELDQEIKLTWGDDKF